MFIIVLVFYLVIYILNWVFWDAFV